MMLSEMIEDDNFRNPRKDSDDDPAMKRAKPAAKKRAKK